MKTIHYALGLPRSGSTLLMNILQQNPRFFSSSTCPTTYLLESSQAVANSVSEFIAMDQDQLGESFAGFIKGGIDGWYSALTDKPVVFSKSRQWSRYLNILFRYYDNPKFILTVRDLRDIICSFEKLLHRYPFWFIGKDGVPFSTLPLSKRIEIYCTDDGANLGLPLKLLPHVYEWAAKKPNNFYLFRFEDFNNYPELTINRIYEWLGERPFQHDFNNIPIAAQYEHDTVYRAMVSHKTDSKLKKLEPSWPSMLSKEQSDMIIENNSWFYQTFYPEIWKDFLKGRSYE